jgi:hypothetical protein
VLWLKRNGSQIRLPIHTTTRLLAERVTGPLRIHAAEHRDDIEAHFLGVGITVCVLGSANGEPTLSDVSSFYAALQFWRLDSGNCERVLVIEQVWLVEGICCAK